MSTTPQEITVFGVKMRSLTSLQRALNLGVVSRKRILSQYGSLEKYVTVCGGFEDEEQAASAIQAIALKSSKSEGGRPSASLGMLERLALQTILLKGAQNFDFKSFNESFGGNFTPADLAKLCAKIMADLA